MSRVFLILCFTFIISCNQKNKPEPITQSIVLPIEFEKVNNLPKAVLYNTDLELDFIETVNKSQKMFKVSEVIITSDRWARTFNEAGLVTARSKNASVLANHKGGCYIQDMVFEQKGDGKVFGQTIITKKSGWNTFDCNLLKIKNPDTVARVDSLN